MKTEKDRSKKKAKKSYRKPELKKVTLAPDEAVLGNCKQSGSTSSSNIPTQICEICGGALGS
jgi:hypothetical protein